MNRRRVRIGLLALPLVGLAVGVGCLGEVDRTYFSDLLDGSVDGTTGHPEASSGFDASMDSDGQGTDDAGLSEDAPDEGTPDAQAIGDAAADAAGDAAEAEAGCGSLATASNCGTCGRACDMSHSAGASCVSGASCSYTGCTAGWGDCDAAAPNTNGCETQLDTPTNCRACGATCDTTHSVGAACGASGCTYTGCTAGWSMCNTTAPNTGGCTCNTPGCCVEAGTCETTHTDGFSQSFYDCNPLNTWTDRGAREACAAYTGNMNDCTDALTCFGSPTLGPYVCNGANTGGTCDTCWSYGGTDIGKVANCQCPSTGLKYLGTWN